MPIEKLREYLDRNNVKYITVAHSPAYTSQEIAALTHITGKKIAKTVIVKADGKMVMVVLPATEKVAFEKLRESMGIEHVRLAPKDEFREKFPDSELGAMPPFGNLYGLEVYVSPDLKQEDIAFNAGSFNEMIVMRYSDFERLVEPKVLAPDAVFAMS